MQEKISLPFFSPYTPEVLILQGFSGFSFSCISANGCKKTAVFRFFLQEKKCSFGGVRIKKSLENPVFSRLLCQRRAKNTIIKLRKAKCTRFLVKLVFVTLFEVYPAYDGKRRSDPVFRKSRNDTPSTCETFHRPWRQYTPVYNSLRRLWRPA